MTREHARPLGPPGRGGDGGRGEEPRTPPPGERVADHRRIEVTALAGIDLQRRGAGRTDAVGVIGGLLVALDDGDRMSGFQCLDRAAEQGRLAGARTAADDDVEPGFDGAGEEVDDAGSEGVEADEIVDGEQPPQRSRAAASSRNDSVK